ncbi:MAG: hypothetical protein HRU23_17065 [Gammaproteobacteria bacterium]|nr:hypothetical protein [Gammaproteobacteria bacterium]
MCINRAPFKPLNRPLPQPLNIGEARIAAVRYCRFMVMICLLLLPWQSTAQMVINLSDQQVTQPYKIISDGGSFELTLQPVGTIALNKLHSWRVSLVILDSNNFSNADISHHNITVTGGMAAHGHGLATKPMIGEVSVGTDQQIHFLIQGLKFQMFGQWTININVETLSDFAQLNLELRP